MKRRTPAELEASKVRARRRRRLLLGWPPDRLDDAPRVYARRPHGAAPVSMVAVPDLEPHPLVDQALAALRPYERNEIGSRFDAIARDLVGEFVLAAIAGSDPLDAVRRARSRYRHDRAALVYGTALTTGLTR